MESVGERRDRRIVILVTAGSGLVTGRVLSFLQDLRIEVQDFFPSLLIQTSTTVRAKREGALCATPTCPTLKFIFAGVIKRLHS
jgi:hypothetical protein